MRAQKRDIIKNWKTHDAALWGRAPQCLEHTLHDHDLFSDEALAELIEKYPKDRYNLLQWTEDGGKRDWREGEFGEISGRKVLESIEKGHIWINLKNVGAVDKRYGDLMDSLFAEVAEKVPGLETLKRVVGILISSPQSRTHYHADVHPGTCWHIRGRKRFYVYPPTPPFLKSQEMEDILLSGVEVDMPYEPWFDEHAKIYDLEPGQMLHWQHKAPHRVENLDSFNVSALVEYRTKETHRTIVVMRANAILRRNFGLKSQGTDIDGVKYWCKFILQAVLRKTSMVKKELKSARQAEFCLDPENPGRLVSLSA